MHHICISSQNLFEGPVHPLPPIFSSSYVWIQYVWGVSQSLVTIVVQHTHNQTGLSETFTRMKGDLEIWSQSSTSPSFFSSSRFLPLSLSRYVLCCNGAAFSRKSALAPTLALSTSEAELISVASCVQEVNLCRKLVTELGFIQPDPTPIAEDNTGVITLFEGVHFKGRSKHVQLRWYSRVRVTVRLHRHWCSDPVMRPGVWCLATRKFSLLPILKRWDSRSSSLGTSRCTFTRWFLSLTFMTFIRILSRSVTKPSKKNKD